MANNNGEPLSLNYGYYDDDLWQFSIGDFVEDSIDTALAIDSFNVVDIKTLRVHHGTNIDGIVQIGSHLAVIVGSDTFWIKTDSL